MDKKSDPEFNYKQTHTVLVTEDLISHLTYNQITMGVYGMIESKKGSKIQRKDPVKGAEGAVNGNDEDNYMATGHEDEVDEDAPAKKYATMGARDKELETLRKKNQEL